MKLSKKMKWVLGAVILVLIIVLMTKLSDQGAMVLSAQVTEGEVSSYIEDRAQTSLPDVFHLTMPQPGRVLPITLKEGTQVKAGEVVATLEASDLNDALTEAQSMVVSMVQAAKASQSQVSASETRKDYLEWLWKALDKIYELKQISEKEAKQAKADYLEAKMEHEGDTADYYAWNALAAASKLLPIYVKRRLNRTVMTTPIDGVILRRYVRDEKVMVPGEPLLDIGNLEELQVTAPILTEDAVNILPGDPVDIYGEAIGEKPVKGKVIRVKPQGFTKLSSLGVEQQRVDVIIAFNPGEIEKLKQKGKTLGLGYRVRVRIYTDKDPKTLMIPRTACFRGQGKSWQVYVIDSGKAVLTEIVPGIGNEKTLAVKSGLTKGQKVIVAPDSSLTDGAKVQVKEISAK